MSKPIIGYTTRSGFESFLHRLVGLSIRLGGGTPLRLHPQKPYYDKKINGLIIGGGTDLYPVRYNGLPKADYIYDEARDVMEIEWLNLAEKNNIPVFGICRGAQLMNVARGGSLHVDISKVYERAEYPSGLMANLFFRKKINIKKQSKLFEILPYENLKVNSMHKQAIDVLGNNLIVSATEDNGVVQVIEDPSKLFYMGVQFHPEALIYQKRFRGIFKKFIQLSNK